MPLHRGTIVADDDTKSANDPAEGDKNPDELQGAGSREKVEDD